MIPAILVIEDELPMRRVLRSALGGQGYRVWEAGTVEEGLSAFAARSPQVVLLDLGLPDGEGFEVVERIRDSSGVPIVVISARGDERDQVRALDSGANDYVTKPFREAELFARVRAALRGAARVSRHAETLTIGPLRIHCYERRVYMNDVEIELTPTEYNLLNALAREAGRVITHRQLLRQVWGPEFVEDVQYLRVFMKQLRHKLEPNPTKPQLLVTTPGVGYRLRPPD
ncbi:MAG TPA: response regulator [Polyangiaceae bacterium]|nr:response regulator [Polyangiaceae bacterium]